MFGGMESSGNIRYQVGQTLNSIRERVAEEDTMGLCNQIRLLVALCSPHLRRLEIDFATLRVPDVDDESETFEAAMKVLETLLPHLADAKLYAFVEQSYNSGLKPLGEEDGPVPDE